MSSTSIELRFIHTAPTTPKDDEIVRITPYKSEDNGMKFMWRYIYNSHSANVCLLESEFHLREKLRALVELMGWDADPYENVQLLLPTMPSVLFRANTFPKAFETVLQSISAAIRHWPARVDLTTAMKMSAEGVEQIWSVTQEAVDAAADADEEKDEDEDEDEDEEDEDEEEEEEVAPTPCCRSAASPPTACTRSGRCYSPLRATPARKVRSSGDDLDGPPPLVRLSRYDLGDGYGSYFEDRCGQPLSSINNLNPEEGEITW